MKTPEYYIEQFENPIHSFNEDELSSKQSQEDAINEFALKCLKSMQADRDKELIEFAEYSQKRGWEPSWHHTEDKEKLTQFRNRKQ